MAQEVVKAACSKISTNLTSTVFIHDKEVRTDIFVAKIFKSLKYRKVATLVASWRCTSNQVIPRMFSQVLLRYAPQNETLPETILIFQVHPR